MVRIISIPLSENIQDLYRLLQSRGIRLLVVEEGGEQVLYAEDEAHASAVHEAYRAYRDDQNVNQQVHQYWRQSSSEQSSQLQIWPVLLATPMVSLLLFSLLFVAVWTGFGQFDSYRDFLILDRYRFDFPESGTVFTLLKQLIMDGEAYRLLAPAWLHWSVFHWLFNSLGLWILGRSLEQYLGSMVLLLMVLFSALIANIGQFIVSGAGFGGFSGVVFALVGAHAIGILVAPEKDCWAHRGIVGMSVIWMVAAMVGVTEWFGVHVANTAHFMGFIAGAIWIGVTLAWQARSAGKQSHG